VPGEVSHYTNPACNSGKPDPLMMIMILHRFDMEPIPMALKRLVRTGQDQSAMSENGSFHGHDSI
jgi:hypothetical protein